ncbi:MAG: MBL fold metallo-hydrolase [Clostridia bacterium]|nr:MBL fold metallo-hydrolase [Clostridia bacterium]
MIVYTLFSGSSGNCVYVKDKNTEILIDAGKSAGAIEKSLTALNSCLSNIEGIFLTHEHTDHTVGLEIISKKYHVPVHMTEPSYQRCVSPRSYLATCAKGHEVRYELKIGTLKISSFEIPHDSMQNVGYIIENDEGEKFGLATDMGHITEEILSSLVGCHYAVIESNHDIGMLKSGPYPYFLKQRILSDRGHLCNEECARLSLYLAENGTKSITLAHLSRENNTPDRAFSITRDVLNQGGYPNVELNVASPFISICVHK